MRPCFPDKQEYNAAAERSFPRNTMPQSNTEKELDGWVSGNDPMTGAQASYLKTLSEECGEPDSFQPDPPRLKRQNGSTRSRRSEDRCNTGSPHEPRVCQGSRKRDGRTS